MADVVNAPLAEFDGRDWHEFHDFALLSALQDYTDSSGMKFLTANEIIDNKQLSMYDSSQTSRLISDEMYHISTGLIHKHSTIVDVFPDSTVDCVFSDNKLSSELIEMGFNAEETICRCFVPIERRENLASFDIRNQQHHINDNPVWVQVSGSFNNVSAMEWSQTCARKLQENSLNLCKRQLSKSSDVLDLSDDEELQQSMDLHSLIVSCTHEDEPLATVDQVISEIEEMMEEDNTNSGVLMPKSGEIIRRRLKHAAVPHGTSIPDGLMALNVRELTGLVDELEGSVRLHSETLVTELAAREELDFLKELNNQFISLLLSIQRRRREAAITSRSVTPESSPADKKKPISSLKSSTPTKTNDIGNSSSSVYLTTVVPYDHHDGSPDVNRLQIYIKILSAIDNDSPTVPTLLTDYILRVLCPTM